ncbi:Na/Pi cotransporter family protein [Paenibacillus aceris]|uniref:Phosphate:Na+ symporter n=1 Tax=Paenibacillus aceris TaxID=869555 RepID=A0ABS4HSA5_9BACL|nr:Na/Pi symporter [Paenibacillus aceris]MBP1961478.1 phosphate:Na+ symporter [Paenibacillus aceris]NHW37744.1 Na/Pi cotransporter family protein [Paenibacillus aceris]
MINTIILPVVAGLVLFLFGMKLMETSLQMWAGPRLQLWLERFTRTPVRGLVTGTVLTAALQSSTAITVIAIGLVGAGVLTFPRTLGVILGTNIGTCLTTELIGLSLGGIGVPILIVSASIWMASWLAGPLPVAQGTALDPSAAPPGRREWLRSVRYGSLAAAGFSLVLLGIEIMQTIGPALQSRGLFSWFVQEARQSLLWGIIAGAAVTALVHSSAAVIAMAMGLAAIQGIPVELGIAITIGANVGTCVTALIAGMSSSRAGRYVAWSHILLNVGGAILFYPFIHQLVSLSALLADDASSQIARSQTIFNVACSLIALPFCYLSTWKRLEFRSQ